MKTTHLERWFVIGFVVFLIVAFAMQETVYLMAYAAVCVPYALAQVRRLRSANAADLWLIVLAFAGPASLVVASIVRLGPSAMFHLLIATSAVLAAWAATRDMELYLTASRLGLIVYQAVVFAYLSVVGIADFPLDRMIGDHSSNGITSYVIVLQLNYCLANFLLHRRFSWFTQVATALICFVGFGRGSIVAIASLMVVSMGMLALPAPGRSRLGRYLVFGGAVIALLGSTDEIRLFAEANTKVGAGFQDQSRQRMMADYLNMSASDVVLGRTFERTSIVSDYNGNPHNSFIRAHHIFGLAYLIVVFLFPAFVLVRSRASVTGKIYYGLLMLILYLRIFTEPVLFPTIFDFFFFAMCFVALNGGADAAESSSEAHALRPATQPS